jgi:GNAT superfamily N-acetyltransferase
MSASLNLRPARPEDASLILAFIQELAEYEREPQGVTATVEDIRRDGFGSRPRFHCVIAEWQGQPAGFAFYFFNYSTWKGRHGLYLEDLFVRPTFRGKGIGKALLVHLAQIAVRENCYGMRWQVLDWNRPAIDFYERLGGKLLREWITVRVMDDELKRLAEERVEVSG